MHWYHHAHIQKKRSTDDPDNYHGITLQSCIGKLFAATINVQLGSYLGVGIVAEGQAGFREDYSTLDHYLFYTHWLNYICLTAKGFIVLLQRNV